MSHNKKKGSIGKRLLSFFNSKILTIMLKKLINQILMGNTQIAGMRTIIVNIIGLILALWEFATQGNGLFEFLCSLADKFTVLQVFCHISETQFYVSALVVITSLNNVLRWLSVTPVGVNPKDAPARLSFGSIYISPLKEKIIGGAVIASIVAIIAVIVNSVV
jgi:hypothetical protein